MADESITVTREETARLLQEVEDIRARMQRDRTAKVPRQDPGCDRNSG